MAYEEKGHHRDFFGGYMIDTTNIAEGTMVVFDSANAKWIHSVTGGGGTALSAATPILISANTIQVNTSGASSSTYWRGDFTWVTPTTGGGEVAEARSPILKVGTVVYLNTDGTATNFLSGVGTYITPYEARTPLLRAGSVLSVLTDGTVTNFLRGDGTYAVPAFEARTPLLKAGTVMSVLTDGTTTNFLRGDGTYATPPDTNTSKAGLAFSFSTDIFNPADATNYFWSGYAGWSAVTLAGSSLFLMPMSGIIKTAYATTVRAGSPIASVTASTMLFNINNASSSNLFTSIICTSAINYHSSLSLAIGITQGDKVELQWVTPTWAVNPLGVRCVVNFYME